MSRKCERELNSVFERCLRRRFLGARNELSSFSCFLALSSTGPSPDPSIVRIHKNVSSQLAIDTIFGTFRPFFGPYKVNGIINILVFCQKKTSQVQVSMIGLGELSL